VLPAPGIPAVNASLQDAELCFVGHGGISLPSREG
jgi:hypothetical protein